ncbi:p53 and DNA damage-regulated protein 1 [Chrysoperla carnea]|uniref:p53 and DNA damage-regulated protein 1 n=1 Tax=Chrysoperla carnea TaxID=189513 RepID=UPI001D07F4DA|nr:p53 and DNA damage-regulated protein 1 [Chrysoperla carnea]
MGDLKGLRKEITYLKDVEAVGQSILSDKQEIIDLNKRQNVNREGLRAMQKSSNKKHFISIGGLLIKTDKKECERIINDDQHKIEAQINCLRSGLKVKVNNLRDLEFEPPVPGLNLAPLSKDEMNAVRQVMGGHAT